MTVQDEDCVPVTFDSLSSELLDMSVQIEEAHSELDAALEELADVQVTLRSAAVRALMRRLAAVGESLEAAETRVSEAMASVVAMQEAYEQSDEAEPSDA